MPIIVLSRGTTTLGITKRDADGEVREQTNAKFTPADNGSSVAVGIIDPETMQIQEDSINIYGAYNASGYLDDILKMLSPIRFCDLPDFKNIFVAAHKAGTDMCEFCQDFRCSDCIVREWKDEADEGIH